MSAAELCARDPAFALAFASIQPAQAGAGGAGASPAGAIAQQPVLRRPAAKSQARRRAVMSGASPATARGLNKDNLKRSHRSSRIVSTKQSEQSQARYAGSHLQRWNNAVKTARRTLGFEDRFVPIGGSTAAGKQLLETTRAIMRLQA